MKKILSFFAVMFALLSTALPGWGAAPTNVYLIGDKYGWTENASSYKLLNQGNNYYTIILDSGISGAWKISKGSGEWKDQWGKGNTTPTANTPCTDIWYNSSTNIDGTTSTKTYLRFKFVDDKSGDNKSDGEILMATNEYFAVRMGSGSSWNSTLLTKSGSSWTGTINVTNSSAQFGIGVYYKNGASEINDDSNQVLWYYPSTAVTATTGNQTVNLTAKDGDNGSNKNIAVGEYTVTINPTGKTATFSYQGYPTSNTVGLRGINGDWGNSVFGKLTATDNVISWTFNSWTSGTTFKVYDGSDWYGKSQIMANRSSYQLNKGQSGDDLSLDSSANGKTVTITYNTQNHSISASWVMPGKTDPTLAWSKNSDTVKQGASYTSPSINKTSGIDVTYSSNNTAVATVNASTGVVSLAGGIGTAIITASFAGNDQYNPKSATYTVTVQGDADKATLHYGSGSSWKSVEASVDPETNCALWTISGWNSSWEFYFTASNSSTYGPNGNNSYTFNTSGTWYSNMTGSSYGNNFKLASSANGKDVLITFADNTHSVKADFPFWSQSYITGKLRLGGAAYTNSTNTYANMPKFTAVPGSTTEAQASFKASGSDAWLLFKTNATTYYSINGRNNQASQSIDLNTPYELNLTGSTTDGQANNNFRIANLTKDKTYKVITWGKDNKLMMKVVEGGSSATVGTQPYIYINGASHAFTLNEDTGLYEYVINATGEKTYFRLQNADNNTALGTQVNNVAIPPSGASWNGETQVQSGLYTVQTYDNYQGKLWVSEGTWTLTLQGATTGSKLEVTKEGEEEIQKAEVHRWSLENSWPEGQTYRMFYLSSKQNGSRVSPEWELLPQSNDEYLLDEFMVIPGGNFMVRVFKKTGSTITTEGDYALHNDTNHTSDNYWISKTSSNLPAALTQKKYLRQTTLKFVKDQAFSVWQMGHTIVSIRVKFTDSNKEAKLSYDFRKPSTYKDAPIKGIPFIALNGQDIVAMPIPGGHNYIYDIESQGAPKSAGYIGFTNGWLQFDDEGKALVYDDNQSYYTVTGKGVMNTQGNVDLAGKSMYNTIQPPRNPVWFFNPTTRKNFSSDKMTFKYKGHGADAGAVITNEMLVDPDDDTKRGKIKEGVDFALYEIRDVDMSGNYKIWTGHGSYIYGDTYNGLSFNTNWGVNTDSDIYGAEEVQSKYYRPMTGSGAYEELESSTSIQKTTRPNGQLWTGGDNSNYTFEDNAVGKYFKWKLAEGATSTYVSNLQFYYALEGDYPVSSNHNSAKGALGSTHNVSGYDNDLPGNTGRNYSWLFCNYEGNSTMIELAKSGANTGVITYAVNPSQVEGAAPIVRYTVTLYTNDTPDFEYNEDGTIKGANAWESWSITCDAEDQPNFIDKTIKREGGLETGYYMAQIEAWCNVNGTETKYVSTSDIIRVVGLAGKPKLTATQEIEVDPETEFKTYTFNIKIQADIKDVHMANKDVVEGWDPDHQLQATYIFPFRVYTGTGDNNNRHIWLNEYGYDTYPILKPDATDVSMQVESQRYIDTTGTFDTDENGYAFGKNGNPLYYYTFTGDTNGLDIANGQYKFPALVIEDYVPGKNYEFYVIVSGESAVGNLLARDNESVEMPQAVFTGTAEIVGGNEYNYVAIKNGNFQLTDATLEGQTDALYKTRFSMQAYNRSTTSYNWICEEDGTTPKNVVLDKLDDANNIVELNKVPYFPTEDGNTREQTYFFRTKVDYVRTADGAVGTPAMTDSEVSLDIAALNSPRQGILDTRSESTTWGPLVNGNVGASVADGVDQITIIEKVKEGFYGVVSVYNDALIAAKIAQPTDGLTAKLDMSKLKITHVNRDGYGTNFHKDTHLAKTHANSPFEVKAGNTLRRWDTKPTNDAHLKAPDGFQYALKGLTDEQIANNIEIYYADKGNRGEHEYKRVATKPSEVEPFWAGQGTAEYDDLMNGFYTAEDHYQGENDAAMPAWDGGEMLTLNTFRQLAYTIEGGTQPDLKIPDDTLDDMKTWFESHYNEDNTLKDPAPTPEEYAAKCREWGYVLLRVGHVNHQAFYHPAGWAGLAELVGETEAENGSWKFDMTEYVPLEMDLQYEYPMLGDFSQYKSSFGQKFSSYKAKRKSATSAKTAATPLINDVKAPSTGFLPFDGSTLDTNPIPTGVDNVNADSAANANGWLTVSYDSNSATVSVRSNDAVGRVDIVSLSGSVVASRKAEGTYVELNVSHLAPGAYIVSVNGRGAKKIII